MTIAMRCGSDLSAGSLTSTGEIALKSRRHSARESTPARSCLARNPAALPRTSIEPNRCPTAASAQPRDHTESLGAGGAVGWGPKLEIAGQAANPDDDERKREKEPPWECA